MAINNTNLNSPCAMYAWIHNIHLVCVSGYISIYWRSILGIEIQRWYGMSGMLQY